ncbi:MAG: Bbp16 family capsid cement protein [Paracoccaceae bacterium]
MIIDRHSMFSENQAITATAISTDVIEFQNNDIVAYETAAPARNLGPGNELPILIQVTENFATATSITFSLESSAAAGLTSPTVHWTSPAIPIATLVAGFTLPIRIMPNGPILKFLGMRYTVGGSNATAGKVTAAFGTEQ